MDSKYTINKNNNNYNNKTNNRNNNDDNNKNNDDNNKNNDNNDKNNKHNDLNDKNFKYNVNFHNNFNKTSNIEELITHNNKKQMNINGNLSNTNALNNFANNLVKVCSDLEDEREANRKVCSDLEDEREVNRKVSSFNHNRNCFNGNPGDPTTKGKPIVNSVKRFKFMEGAMACNIKSCRHCNQEWRPRPKNDWNKIENTTRKRPRTEKYCFNNCNRCFIVLQKIEDSVFDYMVQATQQEPQISDAKSLHPSEWLPQLKDLVEDKLKSNLKLSTRRDYTKLDIRGDGNCCYTSALRSTGIDTPLHDILRAKIIDKLRLRNYQPEELMDDPGVRTAEEILEVMGCSNYYAGYVELTELSRQLQAHIAIYLEDARYAGDPWQLIYFPDDSQQIPINMIFLSLKQGPDPKRPSSGHYATLIPTKSTIEESLHQKMRKLLGLTEANNDHILNVLVWNPRSIRSYAKQSILQRILYEKNIQVAFLQETFLTQPDSIPMNRFRVFRSDNSVKRKGVAILISVDVLAKVTILSKSDEGRFIKIRLTDDTTDSSLTLSNIYLEPTMELNEYVIPSTILAADVIAGDMNNSFSGLKKTGVYHSKGITILDTIQVERSLSDHHILIGKVSSFIRTKPSAPTREIVSRHRREFNQQSLEKFLKEEQKTLSYIDPVVSIPLQDKFTGDLDTDLADEWNELRTKEEEHFKTLNTCRSTELNSLLLAGNHDEDTFDKIGSLLQIKKKANLWIPDENLDSYVIGFKSLYKDKGNLKDFKFPIKSAIGLLLSHASNYPNLLEATPSLKIPKTRAYDDNGFTQRWFWTLVTHNTTNREGDIKNFSFILKKIWDEDHNTFFKNKTRMLLFKKGDIPVDWTSFRPISIIPTWLAILEKLIAPIIKHLTKNILSTQQFGFKDNSSCSMAKLRVAYISHKRKFDKLLLVDVKKAFDSVNLDKLSTSSTMDRLSSEARQILMNIINIYRHLQINLYGKTISPEIGLPQGATYSPLLFNIYIDPTIRLINETITQIYLQAFADDIIIQGKELLSLSSTLHLLKDKFETIGLSINYSKCELISDVNTDEIITPDDNKLHAKPFATYLGQEIDNNGIPRININHKTFGKLMDILNRNAGISCAARIKIFKVYMRSKLNHLIPLICLSNKSEEFWTILRKIIFKQILKRMTLPREAASLFKCGFFDIIIRPLMKQINKCSLQHEEKDYTDHLNTALTRALLTMKAIEVNHSEAVMEAIANTVKGKLLQLHEWESLIRDSITTRLWEDDWSQQQISEIKKVKLPGIIFLLSNATTHILKEQIENVYKARSSHRETEPDKVRLASHTLLKYSVISYMDQNSPEDIDTQHLRTDDVETISEAFTIKQLQIDLKTKQTITMCSPVIESQVKEIISHQNLDDALNLAEKIIGFYTSTFRSNMLRRHRHNDLEIELVIDALNKPIKLNKQTNESDLRRKPGRPKKDTTSNSKYHNLDNFVIKK